MSDASTLVSEDLVVGRPRTIGDPCGAARGQAMAMGIVDKGLIELLGDRFDGTPEIRLWLTSPCSGMVGLRTSPTVLSGNATAHHVLAGRRSRGTNPAVASAALGLVRSGGEVDERLISRL
jgi:hypothetical protein